MAEASLLVRPEVLNSVSDPKSLEPEGDGAIPIDVEESSNNDFVTSQAEPETVKGSRASESVPNAEISVSPVLVSGSDDNANQETPFRPSEVTMTSSRMTMTNSRSIEHMVGSDSDAIRGATSEEFSNSKGKQTTKKKNQSHEKDRADEVVPEKTPRRKRKAVTPLPYEAFEEVPVIDMSPVVKLPSIQTVRDAPRHVTTRDGKKKKARVSLDPAAKTGSQNPTTSTQEPPKKQKKGRKKKKNKQNNPTESKQGSSSTDKVDEEFELATTSLTEPAPSVVNNRTPTDGQDRDVLRKEISPVRRPSSDENEPPAKTFVKSKKKKEMRTKAMVPGLAKIQAGLEKCEKNMRELVSLQDEALESMETMKTRLDDALTRTAKSMLETKKAFKSSITVVEEASERGKEVTNRLGRALSPRMGEKVKRENVAGERQEVM